MWNSLFVTILVLAASQAKVAAASGYLGCRFSSSVCQEDETCGQDDLFGQCTRSRTPDFSYDLDRAGYRLLRRTLSALLQENYTWTDPYTQAVLERILEPYRKSLGQSSLTVYNTEEDQSEETSQLTDEQIQELETKYQNVQTEDIDKENSKLQNFDTDNFLQDALVRLGDSEDGDEERVLEDLLRQYIDKVLETQDIEKQSRNELLNRYFKEYYDLLNEEEKLLSEQDDEPKTAKQVQDDTDEKAFHNSYPEQPNDDGEDWDTIYKLQMMRDYLADLYNNEMQQVGEQALVNDFGFLGNQDEEADLGKKNHNLEDEITVHKYEDKGDGTEEEFEDVGVNNDADKPIDEKEMQITRFIEQQQLNQPARILDDLSDEDIEELKNIIQDILNEIDSDISEGEPRENEVPVFRDAGDDMQEVNLAAEVLDPPPEKKSLKVATEPMTVGSKTNSLQDDGEPSENANTFVTESEDIESAVMSEGDADPVQDLLIDTDYTFITTAERLTPELGLRLVEELANIIDLPTSVFSDIRVSDYQVAFRVNPNSKNMTASDIDGEAAKHKDEIKNTMGLSITSTGIGNQSHVEVVEHLPSHTPSYIVLTFILVGCVAGILIAVLIIYVLRKQSKQKAKLQSLTSAPPTDQPSTSDYQDLCRQRMASKSSEKPEPLHRIGSLGSHYSDAAVPSPSSRSSTSSWSEEPVHPNMDISTGHVVLSYMEDHLKNKDRLAKEWEGLCQYEAEPNSTSSGSDPSNAKKNRYPDILPYDHSRVVLNDSTNAAGSDYINANTITDHDPRSPAYIATQGPLQNTVADFWQMVWEQGCMVLVNLTQNSENGKTMCHPYWPDEGSQLYHIYEVHLVSEHIWCDDYLVRSFYLKNLQTNETRTVTQFHYLTWPDMGVPGSPKALLEFRRKVNKSFRGRACPIVVHCSDGCGRTGTYCLTDMVLNRMTKGAKEIDIAATLEHIRDQRMQMVKTREQFDFALKSVAEEVNAILKALPQ
ncbi:receptor-type tyrosine-protein phosphatase-like N [Glandiceps talaboti]